MQVSEDTSLLSAGVVRLNDGKIHLVDACGSNWLEPLHNGKDAMTVVACTTSRLNSEPKRRHMMCLCLIWSSDGPPLIRLFAPANVDGSLHHSFPGMSWSFLLSLSCG